MALFSRKKQPPQPNATVTPIIAAGLDPAREARIFALGSEMLQRARGHSSSILSSKFYSDALMEWSMKDPNFKVQMFRFVDAFPMLRTPEQVFDHLKDYLDQPGVTVPTVIGTAMKAGGLAKGLAAKTISGQITGMAEKFIAGQDAASALPGLKTMWDQGIAFSVDLLGETCVSDAEADAYAQKYLDLINNLPASVAAWKGQPRLESDHLGPIPRVNVSVKISALSARCDAIDSEGSMRDLMKRLVPILETAKAKGVFVNFDMEHHALKDFTLELFMRCVETVDFQAGLAMQAYLKSGPDDARRLCDWAKAKNKLVTVRLVKGAYWDAETIKGEMHGWPIPVWGQKWQTDACYEKMVDILLDACPPGGPSGGPPLRGGSSPSGIKLALGSHNVRSIASALASLEARKLPREAIELQMLHGMADQLKYAAAEMNLRIREYVPVGDMIPGMAYLVRRLLENTSNESWLKAGFMDNADPSLLLKAPGPNPASPDKADLLAIAPERHALSVAWPGVGDGRSFVTEPFRDFSDGKQRQAFATAVARATVPKIASDKTPEQGKAMVDAAHAAFPAWRDADALKRSQVLVHAAASLRQQRDALAGVMIKEAGKTWREADADVCEAIDFCEYYAREAMPLFARQRLGRFIGELDEQWHQPRGVAVVIAPWNFPLAICAGMTAAALVTGNTVVVKPAEQTPGIASIWCEILWDSIAKVFGSSLRPADGKGDVASKAVLQFCPAPGETTGAALVREPRVALIAFTGSRDVGLDILDAAAPASPFAAKAAGKAWTAPTHVKHVVCEMGGKNALIIDTSADHDEAVLAVRHSAFGFQGQKCSACSRVIVVDPAGEKGPAITAFTRRLVEATRALTIGDPTLPGTDVGPVIDADAHAKVLHFVELARKEGCLLELSLPVPASAKHSANLPFVGPTIFSGVKPTHSIAREEIFGPVLVMHAATFAEALEIANSTPYKLTGGVFTRKPSHIELAKREFRVGNLYINRGITGALVARQPFGGFGMSGGGTKAGGNEYLLHFVEPRTSCENTMRRGFAPEL
jgi:RHH-type transcriptional regulator, proline utilization regulon repressor / proline dehydrogenase / delta 1-pyrroline-5-carboxylate dehydrogenase